jgi:hypothetical protein
MNTGEGKMKHKHEDTNQEKKKTGVRLIDG